jgi:ribonucleoside-diphosphate reductase alpha chain
MLSYYGNGVMFVSGLIEVALTLWEDNLWSACSDLMGINGRVRGAAKIEWINRCGKYASKYFDGDIKKLTYCMKDIYNYKLWTELQREYQDVDYTKLFEAEDNTKLEQELACANGRCEV